MWAYGVPVTDLYITLIAIQFLLVLFVFKETYSVSIAHETILEVLFVRAILPWLIVVGLLIFLGFVTKSTGEFSRRVSADLDPASSSPRRDGTGRIQQSYYPTPTQETAADERPPSSGSTACRSDSPRR